MRPLACSSEAPLCPVFVCVQVCTSRSVPHRSKHTDLSSTVLFVKGQGSSLWQRSAPRCFHWTSCRCFMRHTGAPWALSVLLGYTPQSMGIKLLNEFPCTHVWVPCYMGSERCSGQTNFPPESLRIPVSPPPARVRVPGPCPPLPVKSFCLCQYDRCKNDCILTYFFVMKLFEYLFEYF